MRSSLIVSVTYKRCLKNTCCEGKAGFDIKFFWFQSSWSSPAARCHRTIPIFRRYKPGKPIWQMRSEGRKLNKKTKQKQQRTNKKTIIKLKSQILQNILPSPAVMSSRALNRVLWSQ